MKHIYEKVCRRIFNAALYRIVKTKKKKKNEEEEEEERETEKKKPRSYLTTT